MKKKVWIGILAAFILLVGVLIWKGDAVVNMIFYDMDATMDLPENLYDDENLTPSSSDNNE